jgi:hypothetical protein
VLQHAALDFSPVNKLFRHPFSIYAEQGSIRPTGFCFRWYSLLTPC